MWALHSHGAPTQWIRLMLAHEGGVVVQPSLTGGDGLGLCQGSCQPEGPSVEGSTEVGGGRGPGGSPIPGSATCWQGIILFWMLPQELWSHRVLGRDVESVQKSRIDTVTCVQRHLTADMWGRIDYSLPVLKRFVCCSELLKYMLPTQKKKCRFPCQPTTAPSSPFWDMKICQISSCNGCEKWKTFIWFQWHRVENCWFNNSRKSPRTNTEWVTVSGGGMISQPHLPPSIEMWKPDCAFLWVPFENRHTWPSLSCDFTACSSLFLETSYTPQLV